MKFTARLSNFSHMGDMIAAYFDDLTAEHSRKYFLSPSYKRFWSMNLALEQTLCIIEQIVYFQRASQIQWLFNAEKTSYIWSLNRDDDDLIKMKQFAEKKNNCKKMISYANKTEDDCLKETDSQMRDNTYI